MAETPQSAHGPAATATNAPAVGTLRKLKESEALWQKRLEETRARGETKIKYAQAARDRSLAEARQQAESLRTQRLQEARRQAESEAKQVLEGARTEAMRLGSLSTSELDARMDEVLTAVLGDLKLAPAPSTKTSPKGPPLVAR